MHLFFVSTSIFLSLFFLFAINPLAMGLILIFQTISLSLLLAFCLKSSWFIYMLILIFIGGMLVLFIYVTSIFPNEKFSFNQPKMIFWSSLALILASMFSIYLFLLNLNFSFYESHMNFNMTEYYLLQPTKKIFSSQTNVLMMFLVNYLFFCMIVVIKITNFFQGPLRKMTYV
uniref:NADH-ubiquinone oxidoreductase chain 6 n=1 Tax=Lachesilla sp. Lasp7Q TaxID=2597021 RepID=A0A8K1ZFY5_9NEOP|nr:NADH dehydrogenase subunit 6 [Lachesilla sp. Lasp7Q]